MNQVDKMLEMNPLVKFRSQISGYSFLAGQGSSYGTIICRLKPWEEREEKGQDVNSVIGLMYAQVSTIKDAQILVITSYSIHYTKLYDNKWLINFHAWKCIFYCGIA